MEIKNFCDKSGVGKSDGNFWQIWPFEGFRQKYGSLVPFLFCWIIYEKQKPLLIGETGDFLLLTVFFPVITSVLRPANQRMTQTTSG